MFSVAAYPVENRRAALSKHSFPPLSLAESRAQREGREQRDDAVEEQEGEMGPTSSVCVYVCGTQSAASSVLCCFMPEKAFMLTCDCCHGYTVSGFIWNIVCFQCFNLLMPRR